MMDTNQSTPKLIRSLIYMMGSTTGVVLLYMGITLALAHFLSPEDLGILMAAEAFVSLFDFFFALGFKNSVLKMAAKHEKGFDEGLNVAMGNGLLIKLLITVPIGLLVYFVAMATHIDPLARYVLTCYVFMATFDSFARVFGIVRRALGQFKLMAGINMLNRFVRLCLIIVVLKFLGGLKLLATCFLGFAFFRFAVSFISTIGMFKPKVEKELIVPMIKESFKYGIFDFLEDSQNKVDRVMLNFMLGPASVAFYSIPSKLNRFTKIIPHTVSQVFLPTLHKTYEEARTKFTELSKNLSRFLAIAGVLMFLFIFYFSEPVLLKLFGEKYMDSVSIVRLFAFINLMWFLDKTPIIILATQGAHAKRTYIQAFSIAFNVALNFYFISQFGLVGAVYATMIANFVKLMLVGYFSYQYLELVKILLLVALPLLTSFWLPWYVLIPAYIVYVAVAKLITKDDIKIIIDAFKANKKAKQAS